MEEGGMEEGGREVWLDDRMAAFTQRLVSPAETRLTRPSAAQPSPASSHTHEFILTRGGDVLRPRLVFWGGLFLLFCSARLHLMRAAPCIPLPCPLRVDRPFQSRRTKRIEPPRTSAYLLPLSKKNNQVCISVSSRDNRLASSFFPSSLGRETLLGWIPSY